MDNKYDQAEIAKYQVEPVVVNDVEFHEQQGQNGSVGIITLNRPNKLNALNLKMIEDISQKLEYWQTYDDIKAVVIRGAGDKAFCAGGDLKQILAKKDEIELAIHFFKEEYKLNTQIYHYPKPYISLLHGITMGGGCGVSLHGAIKIASEDLVLAMPETGIGFFPDVGASHFLAKLPDSIGLYMGLTGARLTYSDAKAIGLIDYCIRKSFYPQLIQWIADQADINKDCFASLPKEWILSTEESLFIEQQDRVHRCFAKSTLEEIKSALAEEEAWGLKIISVLEEKSPTSLKVTLEQIIHAKSQEKTFEALMQTEFGIAQHFLKHPDFAEGIRAVITEKTNDPKWQPATIEAVKESLIQEFFDLNSSAIQLFDQAAL